MKENVLLKLTDWQARVLGYISHKTGMNYTDICRQALNDYIDRKLIGIDYKSIESLTNSMLWEAWEEWENWNKEFSKMPEEDVLKIKKYVWIFLLEMKGNKQYPSSKQIYLKSGGSDWIEVTKDYPKFNWFFESQWKLFWEIDVIPFNKEDEEFSIQYDNRDLSHKEQIEYYKNYWDRLGEILTEKTKHMRDPKLKRLDDIRKEHGFITEKELNLYLLDQLEKKKGKNVKL